MSGDDPTALEVAEMRTLVVGREVPAVAHRLAAIVDLLACGEELRDDDRALVARVREDYRRELEDLVGLPV
mgnify:CR=1 FL=1